MRCWRCSTALVGVSLAFACSGAGVGAVDAGGQARLGLGVRCLVLVVVSPAPLARRLALRRGWFWVVFGFGVWFVVVFEFAGEWIGFGDGAVSERRVNQRWPGAKCELLPVWMKEFDAARAPCYRRGGLERSKVFSCTAEDPSLGEAPTACARC